MQHLKQTHNVAGASISNASFQQINNNMNISGQLDVNSYDAIVQHEDKQQEQDKGSHQQSLICVLSPADATECYTLAHTLVSNVFNSMITVKTRIAGVSELQPTSTGTQTRQL